MTGNLHVAPKELRQAARHHRDTAEQLRAVPAGNADIMTSLTSLGPVFADLREAGRLLLEERRSCYERQADAHDDLAARLDHAAAAWEEQDTGAAQQIRSVTTDPR